MTPDIPPEGIWAGIASLGVGSGIGMVKLWSWFRREVRSDTNDKQIEAFTARTVTRVQELEKELKELQSEHNKQSITLGVTQGKTEAYLIQITDLTSNKEYWKARAREAEQQSAKFDKAVDCLTAHLASAHMRIAAITGDLDPNSVLEHTLVELPEIARERLVGAKAIAQSLV